MKFQDIQPYPYNAKKHSKKQIGMIADSIERFGFNQPIVVDKKGVIIVGHGRFFAAKLLGLEEVPITVVDLTVGEAKSYRLADNKISEGGEWDNDLVIKELKSLESPELQQLTGFTLESLDEREVSFTAKNKEVDLGEFDHQCPKCKFEFND